MDVKFGYWERRPQGNFEAVETRGRQIHSLEPCFPSDLQVYYYADRIYSNAGIEESNVQYVTVGTGAVNVLMTIVAV